MSCCHTDLETNQAESKVLCSRWNELYIFDVVSACSDDYPTENEELLKALPVIWARTVKIPVMITMGKKKNEKGCKKDKNHRVVQDEKDLSRSPVHPLARARASSEMNQPARAFIQSSWRLLRLETEQSLWATCCTPWPFSWEKKLHLTYSWNQFTPIASRPPIGTTVESLAPSSWPSSVSTERNCPAKHPHKHTKQKHWKWIDNKEDAHLKNILYK